VKLRNVCYTMVRIALLQHLCSVTPFCTNRFT
jgi:hypothetical protein